MDVICLSSPLAEKVETLVRRVSHPFLLQAWSRLRGRAEGIEKCSFPMYEFPASGLSRHIYLPRLCLTSKTPQKSFRYESADSRVERHVRIPQASTRGNAFSIPPRPEPAHIGAAPADDDTTAKGPEALALSSVPWWVRVKLRHVAHCSGLPGVSGSQDALQRASANVQLLLPSRCALRVPAWGRRCACRNDSAVRPLDHVCPPDNVSDVPHAARLLPPWTTGAVAS